MHFKQNNLYVVFKKLILKRAQFRIVRNELFASWAHILKIDKDNIESILQVNKSPHVPCDKQNFLNANDKLQYPAARSNVSLVCLVILSGNPERNWRRQRDEVAEEPEVASASIIHPHIQPETIAKLYQKLVFEGASRRFNGNCRSSRLSWEFVTLFCECRTFVCLVKSNILVPGLVQNTTEGFASRECTCTVEFVSGIKLFRGYNRYKSGSFFIN